MFFIWIEKFIDRKTLSAVYLSCALLFGIILATDGNKSLEQKLLRPLDNSYSILGSKSVFKGYIGGQKVYAFLPYWSLGNSDLNVDKLTDLSYFGLAVNAEARVVTTDGSYRRWRDDKTLARAVKEVKKADGNVSVTLICHDDADIDAVLACSECWENLAQDVIKELTWAGIKDLNVDFEYSGYTTAEAAEKYTQLVGFLNSKLDEVFGDSFVVVSTYADSADRAGRKDVRLTNPESLAQAADALFIMAYDFHRPTSANAGPVSPLAGSYTTTRLNLTSSLEGYLKVVPASKLILGLPFYGYDWLVENTDPMSARIDGSEETGYSGSKTYAEITDLLVKKQIKPLRHKDSETPYFNYTDEELGVLRQVWYDDEESLKLKAQLANQNNLLGVGVWALGFEGGYSDIWKAFESN